MENSKIWMLCLLLLIGLQSLSHAQGLSYVPELSEEKKATKSKQLEGLEGSVEKVTVVKESDRSITLDIHLTGYQGKNVKVMALNKSGVPNLVILPKTKKIKNQNTSVITAKLELKADTSHKTNYVEVMFTNGLLRFKGVSYVYELEKQWLSSADDTEGESTSGSITKTKRKRTPQVIEVTMVPKGKAREMFIRQ